MRSLGSGEQIQSSKDALGGSDLATGERYAWVVQLEGESYPAGISAGSGDVYRYSVFVIDAIDGSVPMSSRRYEPFFVHGFPDLSEYP
ncbi:MAG TPA: hypothetical protein VLB27_04655 [candidate division Zixibacteria bacterium]|nr:hypothetical protein [candidate division Zixibacteria bacterium]